MSRESGLNTTMVGNTKLRLVTSPFDLIEVDLYGCEDKYHVINQPYWIKNSKDEMEEYSLFFHFEGDEEPSLIRTWRDIERFVKNEMMYMKDGD